MSAPASSDKSTTGHTLRPLVIPWPVRVAFRLVSAISTAAAARVAKRLFFSPPLALRRKHERSSLPDGGEPFAFQSSGASPTLIHRQTISGTSWGVGPTVLLVHGWAGHRAQMAAMVAPLTAAGFRVVAADMPAHGDSSGKLSSVIHFSNALQELAARFGPLRGLVAHSFGAAAATHALANGLKVDRVVFIAPPARFDSFWNRFQDALGMSVSVRRRLTADAEAWLGNRFDEVAPITLAPRMTAPLLILHDAGDREVAFEEGLELASKWPGAALHRTEQLGHLRILRDPSSLATAVAFLQAAPGDA
jgi:pimeloyl-ACP methyl ester carboxylesterase